MKATHNFIRQIIDQDIQANKNNGRVITRFPPEPNGFLHIGHAKAICLNFGIAQAYNGQCHLRFDDTNPEKEDDQYVQSIVEDVRWLGFDWKGHLYHASDYFDRLYQYAIDLIQSGKAYVCSLSPEAVKLNRGTLTEPGRPSPDRDRSIEENLTLFEQMKNGAFEEGQYTLRAKIDMASPNINMRDPAIYRIRKRPHQRSGTQWQIYPMYDFTHCISDALEGVTHSICTLEFEDHRPLYDWFLDNLNVPCHPQQIEFSRLNLTHTIMSKRKLLTLVNEKIVDGWDDPRMPTISGLRRRGYTPESIRNFCESIGVTKKESLIDMSRLETSIRDDLGPKVKRVLAVIHPLRVVITNYPKDQVEMIEAPNHPQHPEMGVRKIPFSRTLYIEQNDFMETPAQKFFRLSPGQEVRLRYAYYITCTEVIKDPTTGVISEIRCTYDPQTKGGKSPDGRKVKGTIHWVSAPHAFKATVFLYDRLFTVPNPLKDGDFKSHLNPDSLVVIRNTRIEPTLKDAQPGESFQFERVGYFCVDHRSLPTAPTFNRIVPLKDTWAKIQST